MISAATRRGLWRIGAIIVFCGFPLLAITAIVSNVLDARNAAEQAARKRATTSAIVAQMRKRQSRALTRASVTSLYLTSGSDSLARAEIQERATKLVIQAGGRLAEVQPTGKPEEEAAGNVAIQITLDIDNEGLLNLLYAIESGLPLIDVTDLDVQRSATGGDVGDGADGMLHVDMTLRGHWRNGTG